MPDRSNLLLPKTSPSSTDILNSLLSSCIRQPKSLKPFITCAPLGEMEEETEKFTAEEVSSHSSKNDCWLTIHGKVYDVTDFLEDHPGGDKVLIHASASRDATQSFEEVGHSSSALSLMSGFQIGVLEGFDPTKDPVKKVGGQVKYPKAKTAKKMRTTTSWIDYITPLLILAVASAAWYYLTYMNNA